VKGPKQSDVKKEERLTELWNSADEMFDVLDVRDVKVMGGVIGDWFSSLDIRISSSLSLIS
jgi:hypothetical protein